MFLVLFSAVLLFLCSGMTQSQRRGRDPAEQREIDMAHLMWHASQTKQSRPGIETVLINMTLTLTHIIDLDTDHLLLHSVGYILFTWNDDRLARKFSNIEDLKIDAGKIWTPDIELYNAAAPMERLTRQDLAVVYKNGDVNWFPSVGLHSFCDRADDDGGAEAYTCTFNFGSWMYNGFDIDLQVSRNDSLAEFVPRPGWHINATSAERWVKYYPCCVEPYPSAIFTYKLVRA